jgi:CRP-like cAMP-binding protein
VSGRGTHLPFRGERQAADADHGRPGRWFGDPPLGDEVRTHDAHVHGETRVAAVGHGALQELVSLHTELYPALLRLQSLRLRQVFGVVEELASLGLRARLVRQLLQLARTHGVLAAAARCASECACGKTCWRKCSAARGSA